MSILSAPHFHNETAAIARLEAIVWPNGVHCPRCGSFDRITRVKGGRVGLYRCGPCKREFTVRIGTIFERSHVPLHKWFQAAHLLASSKKGFSAHQLHRTLKVQYKTAWFMEHRLREAMRELHPVAPLGAEGQAVEADETFVGGKKKNWHKAERAEWGWPKKEAVLTLVERGGRARSTHVAKVNSKTLRPMVMEQLSPRAHLNTDEAGHYAPPMSQFASHETVNHRANEYVRGDAHTNTVEGYFSVLKRGITGVYHHVSQQHLKRYLAEFDFRYNARSALGVDDQTRTDRLIRGIIGKRLTYRDSSVKVGAAG